MVNRNLLFSEKTSYRLQRHLLFWFTWWLYFGFVHALNPMLGPPGPNTPAAFVHKLPFAIIESLLLLIPQTVLAYPLIYFILPRFIFTAKYLQAVLWTLVFMIICIIFTTFMVNEVNAKVINFLLPERFTAGF